MTRTVRPATTTGCTPDDRVILATAFVTPHATRRYRLKIADVHPHQAVADITNAIRDRAEHVRDRTPPAGTPGQARVDVAIPPAGQALGWVARIVHDPDRGNLVVETILEHRDDWDVWPPPDSPSPPGLWLSTVTLDTRPGADRQWVRDAVADVCTMYRRVLDLVEDHPDGPRPLWAHPRPGTLLIRSTAPVTATPTTLATGVKHRSWTAPDRPGRWVTTMAVNPSKGRRRKTTPLRGSDQHEWVARKLTDGATVHDVQEIHRWSDRGRRAGRRLTERGVLLAVTVEVHDPAPVVAAAEAGLGRGKAWGRGLTLWSPADDGGAL